MGREKKSLLITTATNARTFSVCLSPRAPPSRTGARNVKAGPFSCVLSPRVILRSSACTFCHTGMFCRRVPKYLSLFSSNIVIHLSSSLDVCIGVRECTRALCCVVLLSPLQIRIKMNLFCILGRLQGHRCQLCQI